MMRAFTRELVSGNNVAITTQKRMDAHRLVMEGRQARMVLEEPQGLCALGHSALGGPQWDLAYFSARMLLREIAWGRPMSRWIACQCAQRRCAIITVACALSHTGAARKEQSQMKCRCIEFCTLQCLCMCLESLPWAYRHPIAVEVLVQEFGRALSLIKSLVSRATSRMPRNSSSLPS